MRILSYIIFATITFTFGTNQIFALDGKISGLIFGDYYWVAANHNNAIEGENGFWFRRIYFTYDQDLSKEMAFRLRFEMNSPGDFRTRTNLQPFVKDAYLKWSLSNHTLYLGISSTPTWDYIEKFWGFRPVEKTLLDLQKFGTSRDFGVALKGTLDQAKHVHYHLMLGNGNGTRAETNEGKKLMASVRVDITEHLSVEGYFDWDDRPGDTDRLTIQGFAAYKTEYYRVGFQIASQNREFGPGIDSKSFQLLSIFGALQLQENLWGFARLDHAFDPNPQGESISYIPFSSQAQSTLLLLGIDYLHQSRVHLMPNVEIVIYGDNNGFSPGTDFIPRLTFYFAWKE